MYELIANRVENKHFVFAFADFALIIILEFTFDADR